MMKDESPMKDHRQDHLYILKIEVGLVWNLEEFWRYHQTKKRFVNQELFSAFYFL